MKNIFLKTSKGINLRNFLVVFQFSISLFLIISTFVISSQLSFIRSKKLGFNRENVVVMNILNRNINRNRNEIKNELMQYPGIKGVSFTQTLPTYINWDSEFDFEGRGEKEHLQAYFCQVDYDFLDVFDMEIISGRKFSRKITSDALGGGAYILNETAVNELGWENPLGREMGFPESERKGKVVGVVKDFNSRSLHFPTEPVVLILNNAGGNIYFLSVKVDSENMSQAIAAIKKVWDKFSGGYPFEYYFLDDAYDRMYKSEMNLSQIFRFFTFLAIFISCLGLFGLASFVTERRTKEIGIRKVLGASVPGIFVLLSRGFTKWVLLSNIIAWPVAYFTMSRWLQNFAFRINISLIIFFLSSALALLIAIVTVSFQTAKAALSNPVDSLRYE